MEVANLEKIKQLLELMCRAELAGAEFYKECAAVCGSEDSAFWNQLVNSECRHSQNIDRMKEIVTNKSELFEIGRLFNPVALQTFIKGINENTTKIKSGIIKPYKAYFYAYDIERSLIENKYQELLKTKDIEYNTLVKEIMNETVDHNRKLNEKIRNLNNAT